MNVSLDEKVAMSMTVDEAVALGDLINWEEQPFIHLSFEAANYFCIEAQKARVFREKERKENLCRDFARIFIEARDKYKQEPEK